MGHSEIPESIVNKFLNYNNSLQVLIIIIFFIKIAQIKGSATNTTMIYQNYNHLNNALYKN